MNTKIMIRNIGFTVIYPIGKHYQYLYQNPEKF